ncbi:MAG: phosphotransferase, partial [Acidimicrobiales bacterium]|nr:phosphotransferase [Acidimicrobiales bacterium]
MTSGGSVDPYQGLVRAGSLRRWFDDEGLGTGSDISFERVAAGESNEVFIVRRGGSTWALRRPSAVPLSVEGANAIMVREYRFQGALDGSGVPHAKPLALCMDTEVTGAVFYVMEFVDGLVLADPPSEEV